MHRGRTLSLSFPPFEGWVKRIVLACAGIYFLQVVFSVFSPGFTSLMNSALGLVPSYVVHYGLIWQLVTYSFLHAGLMHLLVNMLTLWMFGAQEEQDWGSRKFLEFYLFCVVGAGLITMAVAYIAVAFPAIPGVNPDQVTIGASGGIYGLLIAFGMLYGDREIFMFPLPFMMKAKYMVGIMIFLVVIATFQPSQGGVANFAHLGGLLFGFLYIKFVPSRGLLYAFTERYYGVRKDYYRAKRRRAAKKFEVYMRQHGEVPGKFDEFGNYIPPDESKKNGEGKSGWVN